MPDKTLNLTDEEIEAMRDVLTLAIIEMGQKLNADQTRQSHAYQRVLGKLALLSSRRKPRKA